MKKIFYFILLLIYLPINAQKYELGKVTVDELSEKVHPQDSSAAAAILFKIGEVQFEFSAENGFEMVTNVKTKIKIYKKDGYDWANFSRRYYIGESGGEQLNFKNACTYNLVDGKIEKVKLKSDGEFTEKVNKFWGLKKITMPNIKEGSIIEFEYVMRTRLIGTIDEWYFQTSIPTNYSEFKTSIPEYFVYNTNQKGYVFPIIKTEPINKSFNFSTKERSSGLLTTTSFSQDAFEYKETKTTYTIKDVPALKDESFVNNINNYVSSIFHELSMTKYPNQPFKNYSTDWASVTKTIYENENFGPELSKTGYFENDIDLLIKEVSSEDERISIIFDYVKSKIKWNEYYGYYCDGGVKKAYKDQTGNVAEINLMLVAMLNYAKIDASPILLSTRSNGIPFFPNRSAFNYVIAGVELQDRIVLLDATDKFALPNILPIRDLNWTGRIIRKNGSSAEIDLMPTKSSVDVVNMMATISGDAIVEGKVREQYFDYNAYNYRNMYGNLNKESYLEKLEKKLEGIEINDIEINGVKELSKPVVESYTFKHSNAVEIIGNKMYFSPMLFFKLNENPFKQEKREYPVDFAFVNEDRYMLNITIPDGYVVETLPQSRTIPMSDNLVLFKYLVANTDNKIQVSVTFNINSPIISPEYYDELKAVFSEIVKAQNEKIVIKKI